MDRETAMKWLKLVWEPYVNGLPEEEFILFLGNLDAQVRLCGGLMYAVEELHDAVVCRLPNRCNQNSNGI